MASLGRLGLDGDHPTCGDPLEGIDEHVRVEVVVTRIPDGETDREFLPTFDRRRRLEPARPAAFARADVARDAVHPRPHELLDPARAIRIRRLLAPAAALL